MVSDGRLWSATADSTADSTRVVVPESIDRTGATDVTEALAAFIRSQPPGTTVLFPVDAAYRVRKLDLRGLHDLTIDLNGWTK